MKGKNIYIIWWCLAISHEQESCILQEYLNKLICDIDFIQQNNKQANIKKKNTQYCLFSLNFANKTVPKQCFVAE